MLFPEVSTALYVYVGPLLQWWWVWNWDSTLTR